MAETERTRVEVLTGFLGSGKTTLLNLMLGSGAFDDTAVVVNELGEIGLDHLLVERRTDQVALLEGGCLCCTVVDSLSETLLELCRKRAGGDLPPFRRIVIETTGLADPGPIVEVVRRSPLLAHFLEPGLVVTALDMIDQEAVLERHPEALFQVLLADRIVLTKLDLRAPLTNAEWRALEGLNPIAEIVDARVIEAEPARLLRPVAASPLRAPHDGAHDSNHAHHSHGVCAYGFIVEKPVTRAGLAAFARAAEIVLGEKLLRCKGVLECAGGRVLVQGVRTRFAFEDAQERHAAASGKLTCIVQNTQRERVEALLGWLHVSEGTMPPNPEELS